jgi:rubrerythrin
MKAFAGESMARNRYTFSAEQARKQNLHVIESVFTYTANQEKEHGEIFYQHLKDLAGKEVNVNADYPIDITNDIVQLLRYAQEHEYAENSPIYSDFANTAKEEGFMQVYSSFNLISKVEKTHGDRFGMLADLIEKGKLFVNDVACDWVCLNCGHIHNGTQVPEKYPICQHDKGFFIRLELAPFTEKIN